MNRCCLISTAVKCHPFHVPAVAAAKALAAGSRLVCRCYGVNGWMDDQNNISFEPHSSPLARNGFDFLIKPVRNLGFFSLVFQHQVNLPESSPDQSPLSLAINHF